MKKLSVLLVLALLAAVLAGCQAALVNLPAASDPTVTAAPQRTDAPAPQSTAPEQPATETEPIETAAPTTAAPTAPPTTEPPAPKGNPYFTKTGENVFNNGAVEIRLEGSAVIQKDLGSGKETLLFTEQFEPDTNDFLVGVTTDRLYFAYNSEENWWGYVVYSVDHSGGMREALGGAWDPVFQNGWLALFGFRSDVSPTELRLIDRDDRIVCDYTNGEIWDGTVYDEFFFFIQIENAPDWSTFNYSDTGSWNYDLVRVDPDGTVTVVKVFPGLPVPYSPAFIQNGVICFYDLDQYYDLITLQPTSRPN